MDNIETRDPDKSESPKKRIRLDCQLGERCYRKKRQHFMEYQHQHLNLLLKKYGDSSKVPQDYRLFISRQTLKEQMDFVKSLSQDDSDIECIDLSNDDSPVNSPQKPSTSTLSQSNTLIEENSFSDSLSNSQKPLLNINKKALNEYKKNCFKKNKISVKNKMEAAAPYNIFLTTVEGEPRTHGEPLSISFPELLDPYFGELESSLQINFMVQFGFLLAQYQVALAAGENLKPLTLLYGDLDVDLETKFDHFLTHAKIKTPSTYGTHHTKMMIFAYKDKSIRVVVSTANLLEDDWKNRTQGVWISPTCPRLPPGSGTDKGDSVTHFKRDLMRYLAVYRLPALHQWIEKVRGADMSQIKVFFVASIPGTHTTHKNHWGQLKLASLLQEHIPQELSSYSIIIQCSSIGSLGSAPHIWFLREVVAMLNSCKDKKYLQPQPPIHMHLTRNILWKQLIAVLHWFDTITLTVYPSFECIANSLEGMLGGGCLPYSKKTHTKQGWLKNYMSEWKSETRFRTRVPPHIKSYTRVSSDNSRASFFLLTSANLSKSAWGCQTSAGGLNILSYEAGVLLIPQFLIDKVYFPLKPEDDGTPVFSLPYDLPLCSYGFSTIPWFIDCIM